MMPRATIGRREGGWSQQGARVLVARVRELCVVTRDS